MSTEIAIKKHWRPNFTSEDFNVLADAVASNKAHLFGRFTNTITANSKSSIWRKLSTQINAGNDTVRRTGEEVKRKWTDWSSTIKTKNAKRNVTRRMTGGGPAVPESTDLELKVLAVIGKDATDGFDDGWILPRLPQQPRLCLWHRHRHRRWPRHRRRPSQRLHPTI